MSDALQPDQPPFALTIKQAKNWSPQADTASADNVSQVALARRISAPLPGQQQLDTQAKVLYAPDGMNNFANYLKMQPQFNLYNFTHWSQIDVLNWFAGTADLTVQIPARPWVDTAHKNGVKVIGSVFLGIAQWGGNPDTVEALLDQDQQGRFILADKLLQIAGYYGFQLERDLAGKRTLEFFAGGDTAYRYHVCDPLCKPAFVGKAGCKTTIDI